MRKNASIFSRHPGLVLTVFLLVCFAVILTGTEAVLRRTQAGSPYYSQPRYLSIRELARNMDVLLPQGRLQIEESTVPLPKYYRARTDSNGFLMPSAVHENPDLIVAFVGGSTTETIMVEEEKRWPYLAGRLLESQLGAKVNSLNAGVGANHTMHSALVLLAKIVPQKANIAVLGSITTDLGLLYNEDTYWSSNAERSLVVESQDNDLKVTFFRFLRDLKNATFPYTFRAVASVVGMPLAVPNAQAIEATWSGVKPLNTREIIRTIRSSLLTFVGISKAWGITPVLMTDATRYSEALQQTGSKAVQEHLALLKSRGLTVDQWNAAFDQLNETIRDVGKDSGVQVVDLDRLFPKKPTYFIDMTHFNTAGSELAAQMVVRELAPTAKAELQQRTDSKTENK